jgi:hypothetical protein
MILVSDQGELYTVRHSEPNISTTSTRTNALAEIAILRTSAETHQHTDLVQAFQSHDTKVRELAEDETIGEIATDILASAETLRARIWAKKLLQSSAGVVVSMV